MTFHELLTRASAGGGVLFCGGGFSADCLNLSDNQELGTSAALLELLNGELKNDIPALFRDLKNAADEFRNRRGEPGLLALLRDRFRVSRITDEMSEIMRFPWDRVYTTNYDNALQLACTRAQTNFKTLNNLDTPESVPGKGLEIVHLHGCAEKWDIHNFDQSCVLGADSYFQADRALGHWAGKLQDDFERARLFVFVGFATGDFHLSRIFFNAKEAHPKVFFVNRSVVVPDADLQVVQKKFGTPLSIGRSGLSGFVRKVMAADSPIEPQAPSYLQYERPSQAGTTPPVDAIRDLFVFGKVDRALVVRDMSLGTADYHVPRGATNDIIKGIDNGKSATLITGEICDGKSLVVEELCAKLSLSRPVYVMKIPYETIVDETNNLILAHGNPAFFIENCFELSSRRLEGLLRLFEGSRAAIILTSRSISARAEVSDFQRLNDFKFLQQCRLSCLDNQEIAGLVRLADQIGGWAEFPRTHGEKLRFIRDRCRGSLPAFLLELLKSNFVRDRYAEEYGRTVELCSPDEITPIIASLYIAHIGYDAPLSFLSNIFQTDVAANLSRIKTGNQGLHLVRIEDGRLKTLPSIGASRILREIVPSQDRHLVVDTVVKMLKGLSKRDYRGDFERHVFAQLMRYSILATVVKDVDEVNRFFDNVSKIDYCRTRVLFWLQWHMAMVDQKRFSTAETYLKNSYSEAKNQERRTGEKYDLRQIDDQKAKFLMIRDRHANFGAIMIYDLREACQITERLLHRSDLTHHPFDTLAEIVEFFNVVGMNFAEDLRSSARQMINRLGELAQKRADLLDAGYPMSRARQALDRFRTLMN